MAQPKIIPAEDRIAFAIEYLENAMALFQQIPEHSVPNSPVHLATIAAQVAMAIDMLKNG